MRLTGLAIVLALSLALAPLAAKAQQSEKTYRIGWLAYGWVEGAERTSPEFVHELKKHQQSFVFEFRGHRDEKRCLGWLVNWSEPVWTSSSQTAQSQLRQHGASPSPCR
jgi:hypothetical protein